jgi:hypothetical protein
MHQEKTFAETIGHLQEQPSNLRLKAGLGETPDAQAFREENRGIKATLNKMGGPLQHPY